MNFKNSGLHIVLFLIFILAKPVLANLPDLLITETSIEQIDCNKFKLCYTMRNPTSVAVSAVVDNFIYIDGVHRFSNIFIFPLLPNSSFFSCGNITISSNECSLEHTIQVCADGNEEQDEIDELNNCGELLSFQYNGQIIATDQTEIDFGNTSDLEFLAIWNDEACCPLDYAVEIVTGSSYFDLSPPDGMSIDPSDMNAHDVSVDRSMIPRGESVAGLLRISGVASNSPVDISLSAGRYLADFNADGFVDISDLLMVAEPWLSNDGIIDTSPLAAPDGFINYLDFYVLNQQWLAGY
jgi:hypothetical protein